MVNWSLFIFEVWGSKGLRAKGTIYDASVFIVLYRLYNALRNSRFFKRRISSLWGVLLYILMGIYCLYFLEVRNVPSQIPDLWSTSRSLDWVFESTQILFVVVIVVVLKIKPEKIFSTSNSSSCLIGKSEFILSSKYWIFNGQ